MRVLLHSGGPLGPVGRAALPDFLGPRRRVALVTAASLHDEAATFERVRASLGAPPPEGAGLELLHLRWDRDPLETLAQAEALFMGGGNTYALLQRLRGAGLLEAIRARVTAGMPYMGASAGSNVAGPTILTTNDWNVVALERFDALGLVGFNINPHYKEADRGRGGDRARDRAGEAVPAGRRPGVVPGRRPSAGYLATARKDPPASLVVASGPSERPGSSGVRGAVGRQPEHLWPLGAS